MCQAWWPEKVGRVLCLHRPLCLSLSLLAPIRSLSVLTLLGLCATSLGGNKTYSLPTKTASRQKCLLPGPQHPPPHTSSCSKRPAVSTQEILPWVLSLSPSPWQDRPPR